MSWRDITEMLKEFAIKQCQTWINDEENLPAGWSSGEVRSEYHSNLLCFKHHLLPDPFIITRLTIFRNQEEVGYYELITSLGGEMIDDYFVILQ